MRCGPANCRGDGLQGAGEASVVLLAAPAGYGKSTLLADWVQREHRPVAWLTLTALDNDRKSLPSGITLTPDQRTLVVGSNKKIIAYDIRPDDTIANPKTIIDWNDNKEPNWGPRVGVVYDKSGNLFATGPGGIWIIGPDGTPLGTIRVPEGVVSLAFGDNDGHGLYLAGRRSLYRVRVKTTGVMP